MMKQQKTDLAESQQEGQFAEVVNIVQMPSAQIVQTPSGQMYNMLNIR